MKLRARFVPILVISFSLICAREVSATILTGPIANPTNAHTYFLLAQTNWAAAEAEAVSLGGHLATVNDATENEWIRVTFSNFGGVGRNAWIGLSDAAQEGAWVWINGEPVTFFNWNSGEPNNGAGYYPQEDQVVLLSNGKWNDAADYLTNYEAIVEVPVPMQPSITLQPQPQTLFVSETAVFSVGVSGSGPFTYQWRVNGTNLVGATNNPLTLTNVQLVQAGNYSVAVSNVAGFDISVNALLVVNPVPPCAPTPTNVVGWWSAEGNTLDSLGGNHGTLAGNATNGSGRVGQAFVLDGNRDGVQIGTGANLQLQNFTIDGWIKRASSSTLSFNGNGSGHIFSFGTSGGYAFYVRYDGVLCLGKMNSNESASSVLVTNTTWHHVAVTKQSTNVVFYFDGVAFPAPPYVSGGYTFSAPGYIGAWLNGGQVENSFYGAIDELTVYSQPLGAAEIQSIYNAAISGKCPAAVSPVVHTPPQNLTVLVGTNVTFSSVASGSLPLSYQWRFNGTNVVNATNASLTLSNVQFSNAGAYSVFVTNSVGTALSGTASLIVQLTTPVVRLGTTNVMGGSRFMLPVTLAANGYENALGFSVSYNTQRLALASVELGNDASGATLFVNSSQVWTGRVGVALAYPPQGHFIAGTQEVARLTFYALPVFGGVAASSSLLFGDQPILRELLDSQLQNITVSYVNSTLMLQPTLFEADVWPRPGGNQAISTADWLQLGRYVARLDAPTNASEFQRADCAPANTLGDGQLKVTDWVQAGRYLQGLDASLAMGGPTNEIAPVPPGPSVNRKLRLINTNALQGTTVSLAVILDAQGNENAIGGTLEFNSTAMSLGAISAGVDAGAATLEANASQAGAGRIGFALALPPATNFTAGPKEILRISLNASNSAGTFPLTLSDQVVARCVSDAFATELAVSVESGSLTINPVVLPSPALSIQQSGNNVVLSWTATAANFGLQRLDYFSGNWSNLPVALQTNGATVSASLPATNLTRFFRLASP